MILTGQIFSIGELVENNNFKKIEFLLKTNEQYPQYIKIEVLKKVDIVNGLSIGDNIDAHINIRGNEYNGRHYVSIVCWKIDKKD
jgi:hypothetical protein